MLKKLLVLLLTLGTYVPAVDSLVRAGRSGQREGREGGALGGQYHTKQ